MQAALPIYSMVRSVPAPQQRFAALDHYLSLAAEDSLSGPAGRIRRKSRRFKRAKKGGKRERQVAIAYRLATMAAKKKGKKLDRRKGLKAAKEAAEKSKSTQGAVRRGLIAAGLSAQDARVYATIGIAMARKGGNPKATQALIDKLTKKRAARKAAATPTRKRRIVLPTKTDRPTQQTYVEDDMTGEFEPSEQSEGVEEDEDTGDMLLDDDSEFADEDAALAGFGLPSLDSIKPYFPWVALVAGVTIIVLANKKKDRK
jgi:hypothetical protein